MYLFKFIDSFSSNIFFFKKYCLLIFLNNILLCIRTLTSCPIIFIFKHRNYYGDEYKYKKDKCLSAKNKVMNLSVIIIPVFIVYI